MCEEGLRLAFKSTINSSVAQEFVNRSVTMSRIKDLRSKCFARETLECARLRFARHMVEDSINEFGLATVRKERFCYVDKLGNDNARRRISFGQF